MREVATILFSGSMDAERFIAFAEHRARRLALQASVGVAGPAAVAITVQGEPDLIDAFEMACSLGPATCIVRDVSRCPGAAMGEES